MSEANAAKPEMKYVDFDLPFVLFLKDSLADRDLEAWVTAVSEGKTDLPYARYAPPRDKPRGTIIGGSLPVYLPSADLAPCYEIRLPDMVVGLRTLRRVNVNRPIVLMGELPGDRTGRASFSSVRVMFDLADVRPEIHLDLEPFCFHAIRAVNHFIEHYRVVTHRPWVSPVTMSLIQEFHVTTTFDDGTKHQNEYGSGSGPLNGFGGAISDDLDAKLRNAVSRADPPSIYETLNINILDCLDLQDWRLAVIEAAVLFEAWVHRFVREKYTAKRFSPDQINARFQNSRGLPRSITDVAKNLVLDAASFDFSQTNEYRDWEAKVRDPRNAIVHGQRFNVTEKDARDAYDAVKRAIDCLTKLLV